MPAFVTQPNSAWIYLAEELVGQGVSASLFLAFDAHGDVGSMGLCARISGGELFVYPRFDTQRDSRRLELALRLLSTNETAFNCSLRVRVSEGRSACS